MWQDLATGAGLLVDTNLLVLYIVGSVNRNRIEQFKRTRQYTKADYVLLLRVLGRFKRLFTVAHVLAEVSNLTDLSGSERLLAREILKQTVSVLEEAPLPSIQAANDSLYPRHGLVDASIAAVAREQKCAVLTDDFDLYHALINDKLEAVNFTHLRARHWGIEQR
jgi:predicted nucleic acid-binding protein